jgi:hypothetical protein
MVGWAPRTGTYPRIDLDPAVQAEAEALQGDGPSGGAA